MENTELSALVREKLSALDSFMSEQKSGMAKQAELVQAAEVRIRRYLESNATLPGGVGLYGSRELQTLGSRFVQSPQFKQFVDTRQRGSGKFVMEAHELQGMVRKAATDFVTAPHVPVRLPGIAANVYAPLTVRALLNAQPIRGGAIEYLRQEPVEGAAGVQAVEGAKKAQIHLTFTLQNASVVTTAAFTKVSTQIWSDEGAPLQDLIDSELAFQVDLAEELEILLGVGGAGHMSGLLTLAPTFAGGVSGDTGIDLIARAQGQLAAAGYPITGTVVNPLDWVGMQLSKTATKEYLIGDPSAAPSAPYLWNAPVIASSNMPLGSFLTGAFGYAARLYDRERAIDVAYQNEDDFVRNLVCVRGEVRSALVIPRPAGFLKGSLTPPAGTEAASASKKG